MTPAKKLRAAELLEREAHSLSELYVVGGVWCIHTAADSAAFEDYAEMLDLARLLRKEADADR